MTFRRVSVILYKIVFRFRTKTHPRRNVADAAERAEETITLFAHERPDGSSCFTILREYGISYRRAAENIAGGQPTPAAVVNSWMNSSGHRANIPDGSLRKIGVGYARGGQYGTYWVQLFTD